MLAYKVLTNGRSAFTGWLWPRPAGGERGAWVSADARAPLGLCENGVHACTAEQLPQWLGPEIWEVELEGEILHTEPALVAARARLVSQVQAWDHAAEVRFAQACLNRARELEVEHGAGAELVEKVAHTVSWGGAAPAGYFTALFAGETASGLRSGSDYDAAFARERTVQAEWLTRELALTRPAG